MLMFERFASKIYFDLCARSQWNAYVASWPPALSFSHNKILLADLGNAFHSQSNASRMWMVCHHVRGSDGE